MADNPYLTFLRDPDQAARRAELERFIGRNPAPFMKVYDRLQGDATAGGRPKFRLFGGGFCVPAFLFGPVWFLYRKQWAFAAIIVVLMVVLAFLPVSSRVGMPVALVLGLLGHQVYVQQAVATIQKARLPGGGLDEAALARSGGVSKTAGWIGGIVYGLIALTTIAAMIVLIRAGQPLPQ